MSLEQYSEGQVKYKDTCKVYIVSEKHRGVNFGHLYAGERQMPLSPLWKNLLGNVLLEHFEINISRVQTAQFSAFKMYKYLCVLGFIPFEISKAIT